MLHSRLMLLTEQLLDDERALLMSDHNILLHA